MAAVERMKIRSRTMSGLKRKAEANRYPGLGLPPYGYQRGGYKEQACLLPDPKQARIVRQIFEWYVFGDGKSGPLSQGEIAKRLTAAKVPSPGSYKGSDPNSTRWNKRTVGNILQCSDYRGIHEHGRRVILPKAYDTQPIHERVAIRPDDEVIRVQLPPESVIVPGALWEAAQARLQDNVVMNNRQRANQHRYLLSGYLVCARCGHAMCGHHKAVKRGDYRWDGYTYKCADPDHACPASARLLNVERLDPIILDLLRQELAEPRLGQNLAELRERRLSKTASTHDRVAELERAIRDEKRALARMADRLAETDDETYIESLRANMLQRSRLIRKYEAELKQAQATLDVIDLTPAREREIHEMAAAVLRFLAQASPNPDQVRAILTTLRVKITLDLLADPITIQVEWCLGTEATFYVKHPGHGLRKGLESADETDDPKGSTAPLSSRCPSTCSRR